MHVEATIVAIFEFLRHGKAKGGARYAHFAPTRAESSKSNSNHPVGRGAYVIARAALEHRPTAPLHVDVDSAYRWGAGTITLSQYHSYASHGESDLEDHDLCDVPAHETADLRQTSEIWGFP
jgi:hypothetical protein